MSWGKALKTPSLPYAPSRLKSEKLSTYVNNFSHHLIISAIFFLSFSSIGLETGGRPLLGSDCGGEDSADGGGQPLHSFFHS
jgi:hypothetical protein